MPLTPNRRRSKAGTVVHPVIRERLGYSVDETDAEVLRDWRGRLRRVCKPCWELKYCPYGPFVEQSPLLPSERAGMEEHISYLQNCLDTNQLGTIEELDEDRRANLKEWLQDDEILTWQSYNELLNDIRTRHASESDDPGQAFDQMFSSHDLPSIERYRVSYDVILKRFDWSRLSADIKKTLKEKIKRRKLHIAAALKLGVEDNRQPLDAGRRASFAKTIATYNLENYPENIPTIFRDGECNVFGHICPVFFTAEAITETSRPRRIGRYIPFSVRMRVVRRDNYTCQHCSEHLQDDKVEFDHVIPVAKGGSSEEHNIRLTCFDCNRDKSDDYVP